MAIQAVCDGCFLEIRVKDEFAGRKTKCKSCGAVIRIPRPGEVEPSEFDDDLEGHYDEPQPRRGKRRTTGRSRTDGQKRRRSSARKRTRRGGSSWLPDFLAGFEIPILVAIAVIVLAGIGGLFVPGVGVVIGFGGIAACMAASFACSLWMLVMAFQEDVVCGLLYFFVPFYALYWLITRWPEPRLPFLISLSAMAFAGGFFAYLQIVASL